MKTRDDGGTHEIARRQLRAAQAFDTGHPVAIPIR